ncbi:hypothetical protein BJ138DRAFT_619135 [Hygrophoropsis aurantiaca]|uniref:Uncharacterized protein n=1 Tax=Hygrophoropsis aurantiaca TaxID=72124 RepID=A0ACB8A0P1_9AGAM|nr:hypothetical protein BJ138DRAFT_619135 [Hygrophoropsis aurantiaca]
MWRHSSELSLIVSRQRNPIIRGCIEERSTQVGLEEWLLNAKLLPIIDLLLPPAPLDCFLPPLHVLHYRSRVVFLTAGVPFVSSWHVLLLIVKLGFGLPSFHSQGRVRASFLTSLAITATTSAPSTISYHSHTLRHSLLQRYTFWVYAIYPARGGARVCWRSCMGSRLFGFMRAQEGSHRKGKAYFFPVGEKAPQSLLASK